MVDAELFSFLAQQVDFYIDNTTSTIPVIESDPTQEIKIEQEQKNRDAIVVMKGEQALFIDYQHMISHFPEAQFRKKSARELMDDMFHSKDIYEFIKFLKAFLNDTEFVKNYSQGEDFEVRFFNFGNLIRFTQVNSKMKGRLVTMRGTVFYRWDEVRQFVTQRKWICFECGTPKFQFIKRGEKLKKLKGICNQPIGEGDDPKAFICRSTKFTHIEDTKYEDLFRMKLEALPQDTPNKLEIPTFTLEFTHNLCHENFLNNVVTGTAYEFTGFIRLIENKLSSGEVIFKPYMEVMSFKQIEKRERKIIVTEKEHKKITEFLKKADSIEKMTENFGKRVIGFKREKKLFIVLKTLQESFNRRKEKKKAKDYLCHILLVGDYATGKSELAEVFEELCENSYYIIGSSTSQVGLTGITERDEMTGQFSIQAGILARASGDTLIVEEFDKKENKAEFGVLNEAMTKFEYTVTKGGKHRSFRCNTTIIVVANPVGKKFDITQSIVPQIDIAGDLLSRFTVISAILDRGDIEVEHEINKIMLERGNKELHEKDKANAEYLKKCIKVASEYDPDMNTPELAKFINNFTQEAVSIKKSLIYERDIKFWENYGNRRNRESLIKIIKGIAMLHCHEKPTQDDMKEGLHLFRAFMKDLIDYNVLLDPDEIATGRHQSIAEKIEKKFKAEELIVSYEEKKETKKGQMELFLDRVQHIQENSESGNADIQELEAWAIQNLDWTKFKFEEMMKKLIESGELFEPNKGYVQRLI